MYIEDYGLTYNGKPFTDWSVVPKQIEGWKFWIYYNGRPIIEGSPTQGQISIGRPAATDGYGIIDMQNPHTYSEQAYDLRLAIRDYMKNHMSGHYRFAHLGI